MAITKAEFSKHIKGFQFRGLFNEMGWNNDRTKQPIIVDDVAFNFNGIAEKSGFKIFICEPAPGNKLPDKATRKKIEGKLTRLFQEHLIIFIDAHQQEQVWQLAVRKAGSPTKISETSYSISQDPELLYQRASGLFFTLDEEEKVTIIDVTKRVADNFQQNNERVTKKFYESFKKEHAAFLKLIQGIDDQLHMDWYASMMLNRLMFCYFIQKKGLLDNNKNYLRDKLKACKEKKGNNKFYSFYRDFLLALFHEGLGAPEHTKKLEMEIGQIPYLNGGLFDEHEIEKTYTEISIDDKAFEKLFDFFDEYEWHLDTRETASGRDINPDVIGYIFEKYINDRAQMGAYYTKEDITDYIAKNCIIPWLFDEVKRHYPNAFAADSWLWQMVKTSGDEYIFDTVKYGIPQNGGLFDDMPDEIQKGFAPELENKVVDGEGPWLWELRKSWNKPAPSDIALPTEIYREVIERRKRYADIKTKIESGEIKEINEFITCNLNIRQFAQDVVETTEDAEFVHHIYKALSSITILDPTCGSGAFLFAAMNILELLYEACIVRMKNFIDESKKGRHTFFEETLVQVNAPEHPNLQYFIYKSIILNNLYGVDIMNEAVEIAKLRLFLKLVATVDADYRKPNLGLEPLPDVDFNIRAGNTLVGFANESDLDKVLIGTLEGQLAKPKILEKCDVVARAFARYKEIQLSHGDNFEDFRAAKDELNSRLMELNCQLNKLLHKSDTQSRIYDDWLATHQPFHWFAEFYEIIAGKGGFDVVIGNPPYVQFPGKMKYKLNDYKTLYCANLFAFCIERSLIILNTNSYLSMIVPISLIGNKKMRECAKLLVNKQCTWVSNFSGDTHPGTLFKGVQQNLSVFITTKKSITESSLYTTNFLRFNDASSERDYLFESTLKYCCNDVSSRFILKIGQNNMRSSIKKLLNKKTSFKVFGQIEKDFIYYHDVVHYWVKSFYKAPFFKRGNEKQSISSHYKTVNTPKTLKNQMVAIFASNIFYVWYVSKSNCRDFSKDDLLEFCINFDEIRKNEKLADELKIIGSKFIFDLESNKVRVTYNKKSGTVEYDQYWVTKSKPIIDQIDCLLAQHYGFTHEELDFIINYDIKYRMGIYL